jgi:hypothetical protein
MLTGTCFVAYSTFRYFRVLRLLRAGLFQANTSGVVMMVGVSSAIIATGIGLLLAAPPHRASAVFTGLPTAATMHIAAAPVGPLSQPSTNSVPVPPAPAAAAKAAP